MNNLNECIWFLFLPSPNGCSVVQERKGRALRRDTQPATLPRYPLGRGLLSAGRERPWKPAAKLSGALLNCAAHILGATQEATAAFPLQRSSCCCLFGRWGRGPPPYPLNTAGETLHALTIWDRQSKALYPLWDTILPNYSAFLPLPDGYICRQSATRELHPPAMSISAQMTFIRLLPEAVSALGSSEPRVSEFSEHIPSRCFHCNYNPDS